MDKLILVNRDNKLSKSYIAEDLIKDKESMLIVNREVSRAFIQMNNAIKNNGISKLIMVSAYRPYTYQEEIFKRKVGSLIEEGLSKEEAVDKAKTIVALPGTSEHQTGLAIDISNTDFIKRKDPLIREFEDTIQGEWLRENAYKYGFILRYPKDKTDITYITYEPWHYRYVGTYHAKEMKKRTMCLEEYINYLDKK